MRAMSTRKPRLDVILFLSAFAAILAGLALLLRTTGAVHGMRPLWPILLLALGGLFLCLSFVRPRGSSASFATGLFFILVGAVMLLASLAMWHVKEFWPLFMLAAGFALLASGLRHFRGLKAFFFVPASGFIVLGAFFGLFSFSIVKIGLGEFVHTWWPTILIAAGVVLFVAYGMNRGGRLGPGSRGGADRELGDDEDAAGEP
jgi:hypothetical protein